MDQTGLNRFEQVWTGSNRVKITCDDQPLAVAILLTGWTTDMMFKTGPLN